MRGMILALVLACGTAASGCNNPMGAGSGAAASDAEKQAMAAVLSQIAAADRADDQRYKAEQLDNGRYTQQMRAIDLSGTPAAFREPFQQWVDSHSRRDQPNDLVDKFDFADEGAALSEADRATARQILRDFGEEGVEQFSDHALHDSLNYMLGVLNGRSGKHLIDALRVARRNQVAFPQDFYMGPYTREQIARDD